MVKDSGVGEFAKLFQSRTDKKIIGIPTTDMEVESNLSLSLSLFLSLPQSLSFYYLKKLVENSLHE